MSQNVEYVLSLKDVFSANLQKAKQGVDGFEKSVDSANSMTAMLGGTIAAAFSGVAITQFVKGIIDAGSKVENARTGLTTLLKDGAEAQRVITATMEDATKTPFEFDVLLQANKALISAGESAAGARDTVLNLSNAIAATGGGDDELSRMVVNLQQIRNTGQATAMDIKQFAFAGVNLYKLLEQAGIKSGEGQVITYENIATALRKANEAGGLYENGLVNMAQNTSVRISNLSDAFFQLRVRMFEDMKPAIDAVLNGLGSIMDWVSRNIDVIYGLGVALGVAATGFALYNAMQVAAAVKSGITTALIFVQMVATEGLAAAMYAAGITGAAAWAMMTGGLAILAGALYVAWQRSETFRGIVMGVWEVLKGLANFVITVYKNVGEILAGVFTLDPTRIKEGVKGAVLAYRDAAMEIGDNFRKGQANAITKAATSADPTSKTAGIAATSTMSTPATEESKVGKGKSVSGNKAISINVTIGNLVDKFTVQTTNITESPAKVREMIAAALIGVVNDSQIVAGQ